jgi:4-hydroxy-3-methylbut-2-enyl diphosphate reductase IspH
LAQQLRMRYRDARVTFLETISPSMMQREEALEKALVSCDRVVVVGRSGEATSEALVETALRRGKMAVIVRGLQDLEKVDCTGNPRIALTAGGFALDSTIRAVAEGLLSR